MANFQHKYNDHYYGHGGYPWKGHKHANSLVKKSSDLDAWVKSYDQKRDLWFLKKILIFFIFKKGQKIMFW